MQTYNSLNNQFNYQISIPQDGIDPVSDFTVNNAFKANSNSAHTILNYLTNYKPSIKVTAETIVASMAQIKVYPFTDLFVNNGANKIIPISNNSITSLNNTNFDVGGDFAVGDIYYIYAYGTSSVANFEISLIGPEITRNFKSGDITRRYICSFSVVDVSGNAAIRGFTFLDGKNTLQSPSTTSRAITWTANVPTQISMIDGLIVPDFCSAWNLSIEITKINTITGPYIITVAPFPTEPALVTGGMSIARNPGFPTFTWSQEVTNNALTAPAFTWLTTGATTDYTVTITLVSYQE